MPPFWIAGSVMTGSLSFITGPRPRPSPPAWPAGPAPRSPCPEASAADVNTAAATIAHLARVALNRAVHAALMGHILRLALLRGRVVRVVDVPADIQPVHVRVHGAE